jgi:primosomal protein N' (replication factor Y) (superfamily II helicase)
MFADLYVPFPVNGSFTYGVPAGKELLPGCRVVVDFSGRQTLAFTVNVHESEPKEYKVKEITSVIDDEPVFDRRLIKLSEEIASYYFSSPGEVLSLAVPSGRKPSGRYRVPFEKSEKRNINLDHDQARIYEEIIDQYKAGSLHHLLFGVTGSGKTEVYIELARYLIERGRSVIYLVPEISISSQIFSRLYNVFGDELIIYHSSITPNQRLHSWNKFLKGEARIAVGTRSAVFLQCPDLGAIIVDEEHDGSYKENSSPRYNARRVAFYRSKNEKSLVVLGSATPSVESLYAAESGALKLHRFTKRFGSSKLPEVEVVEFNPGDGKDYLSSTLKLFTKRAVDEGNQVIYLLNRRGFSPFVLCNQCGHVVECPHCSISMNFHGSAGLLCHYCGMKKKLPEVCEKCGSDEIVKLGSGTQRVEDYIKNAYRDFRIFRLDRDSVKKKNSAGELVEKMNRGEIDLLLGTQMVAKGFDFPNVTVVGILMADIGLHLPDFRASERIFSLLVQVAGRSGRGEKPGRVILQTLNSEHPVFRYIRDHDYYSFYRAELEERKLLKYPPYSRLVRLLVRGHDEERVIETVNRLRSEIDSFVRTSKADITVLGPASAPLSKIAKNYRHHIILKSKNTEELHRTVAEVRKISGTGKIYLEIDMDPYDLL